MLPSSAACAPEAVFERERTVLLQPQAVDPGAARGVELDDVQLAARVVHQRCVQPPRRAAAREGRTRIAARGAGARQPCIGAPRTRPRGRSPTQRSAQLPRSGPANPRGRMRAAAAAHCGAMRARLSSRCTSAASASLPKVTYGAVSTRMVSSGVAWGWSLALRASSHALQDGAAAHGGGWNAGGLSPMLDMRCGGGAVCRRAPLPPPTCLARLQTRVLNCEGLLSQCAALRIARGAQRARHAASLGAAGATM